MLSFPIAGRVSTIPIPAYHAIALCGRSRSATHWDGRLLVLAGGAAATSFRDLQKASTLVREISKLGGDVGQMVSSNVAIALQQAQKEG